MRPHQFRISRDGLELSFRKWGAETPAVLLIHGFGEGGFVWNRLAESLTCVGSAIAIDLRGHGESGWSRAQKYDISAYVGDVNHALDALELRRIILVGHSLGAEVAIRIAAARATTINGLIVVDYGPGLNSSAVDYAQQDFRSQSWVYSSIAEYQRRLEERLPLIDSSLAEELAREALQSQPGGSYVLRCDPALKNAMRLSDDFTLWFLLRTIRCRILVIRGAASAFLTDDAARRMSRELHSCKLEIVPHAGHAVMIDNPTGFISAVQPFVASLSAR